MITVTISRSDLVGARACADGDADCEGGRATAAASRPGPPVTTALMLRTCTADMRAHAREAKGFRWPESGLVEAPDWDPTPECGNGLHGLLWGEGSADAIPQPEGARWIVFEVDAADVVRLDGTAKAPRGVVVHVGTRESAVQYLYDHGAVGRAVVYGSQTAGYDGTATAGYGGTATAGDGGTATAGYGGSILLRWWDGSARGRWRTVVGYVGEDGIEPGVAYKLDAAHTFVRV